MEGRKVINMQINVDKLGGKGSLSLIRLTERRCEDQIWQEF